MSKLRIEAEERYLDHGVTRNSRLRPEDVSVAIYDGDNLVAETTLDALVKKFLVLSSEYAQLMAAIGAVKAKSESKIVVAREGDIPPEK